ncbi:MAG: DNA replication/repair protein RecF [Oscillospiraceae bacterium]|nr:DNA replication/repair protein RecF [Oscillospiraceae bacterium]
MYLTRHSCVNFRNIKRLELEPSEAVNVICGKNGQGKTNLLESIFLLTGAKSFRAAKDSALIRQGEQAARLSSGFVSEGREQEIVLTITEKGREASLNKGAFKRAAAAAGKLCCVVFSPEHLSLVKGSPEKRRRFIDTALCQISPLYLNNLKNFTRTLNQRNRLLRDYYQTFNSEGLLDIYDERLAQSLTFITRARRAFLEKLSPLACERYREISEGLEEPRMAYASSVFKEGAPLSPEQALSGLKSGREADKRAGFTLKGPHRDDLELKLNGEEAKAFASQGQQRCLALSLKLAEAELMEAETGERPILLLDDVLSELDEARRERLLGALGEAQAFISCCEPEVVLKSFHCAARVFKMSGGALI